MRDAIKMIREFCKPEWRQSCHVTMTTY